jgi:hypothetical protein
VQFGAHAALRWNTAEVLLRLDTSRNSLHVFLFVTITPLTLHAKVGQIHRDQV